jgi:hypothetical protein
MDDAMKVTRKPPKVATARTRLRQEVRVRV